MLNLTQHITTAAQVAAGVATVLYKDRELLQQLLTFEQLPSPADMQARAEALVELARNYGQTSAMIGGAPFFMPILERELVKAGIRPFYAFSRRESVETVQADSSTEKTSVFKHVGFVEGGLF